MNVRFLVRTLHYTDCHSFRQSQLFASTSLLRRVTVQRRESEAATSRLKYGSLLSTGSITNKTQEIDTTQIIQYKSTETQA